MYHHPARGRIFASAVSLICIILIAMSTMIPAFAAQKKHYLDVNLSVDGKAVNSGDKDLVIFDVYINGKIASKDVKDFYKQYPSGTGYEIKNIRVKNSDYRYVQGTVSGKIGNGNETVILTLKMKTFRVTYDPNGGTGSMNSSKFRINTPTALRKNTFIKNGYIFKGWSLKKGGTVKYTDGQKIKISKDTTLYAVWERQKFCLDVNLEVDGIEMNTGNADIAVFDVYIRGNKAASGAADFYRNYVSGTAYEVKNVQYDKEEYTCEIKNGKGKLTEARTVTIILTTRPREAYVDVNVRLDGERLYDKGITDASDIVKYDVYLNGKCAAEQAGDFYQICPDDTLVEIKNINVKEGYIFTGFSDIPSWNATVIPEGNGIVTGRKTNEIVLLLETVHYDPADVTFSKEAGAYPEAFSLELSCPEGYTVRYTTDCSEPTKDSAEYTEPIRVTEEGNDWVDENTDSLMTVQGCPYHIYPAEELPEAFVVRAAAFDPHGEHGPVMTKTYFVGRSIAEDYGREMVVSIVTDEDNLMDYDTGIMVLGRRYDQWIGTPEAQQVLANKKWYKASTNYGQKGRDWERPASIELFDGKDKLTLQENCGIRIKGAASRQYAQKSFNIYFRKDYGNKNIKYKLFPGAVNEITGKVINKYKGFTLRNGGNDTPYLKFKDGWLQELLKDRDLTYQQSRPAILYLNGEFWGLYNLTDKLSASFFEERYGVEDVLVMKNGAVEEGDEANIGLYHELLSYAKKDLNNPRVWERFKDIVDIQSMADYYAAEIYIGNGDWNQYQNIEFWRSVDKSDSSPYADGRWRFVLYDIEYSCGLYTQPGYWDPVDITKPDYDSLHDAFGTQPLFVAALRNPEFRQMFIDAIKEIGSVNFAPERVNATLDEWVARWQPYMADTDKRFGYDPAAWDYYNQTVRDFFAQRYDYIIPIVEQEFSDENIVFLPYDPWGSGWLNGPQPAWPGEPEPEEPPVQPEEPETPPVQPEEQFTKEQAVEKTEAYAESLYQANLMGDYTHGGFTWDTEEKDRSWTYYNGFMLYALLETDYERYSPMAKEFLAQHLTDDGYTILGYKDGELDSVPPMLPALQILEHEPDCPEKDIYLNAIRTVLGKLDSQTVYPFAGNNYIHKQDANGDPTEAVKDYPVLLDGEFMAGEFLLRISRLHDMGIISDTYDFYEAVAERLLYCYESMRTPSGLLYHGIDPLRFSPNGIVWSRGLGWYMMALTDAADMTEDQVIKQKLTEALNSLSAAILNVRDEDSPLWYNVTELGGLEGNRLETSGSLMFAYSFMKGASAGLLDAGYMDEGLKTFISIAGNYVGEDGLTDTLRCSGCKTSPAKYNSLYVTNEAKGIAPLLLCMMQAKNN